MKFEKGNKKGVRFGSGQDPTKGGRKKLVLTTFMDAGYTKDQIRQTFSIMSGLKESEYDSILKNKEATGIEKLAAKAFKEGIKTGEYKYVQAFVELFADKATQHNVTKLETVVKYESQSDEELDALIKKKMEFSDS